eukprot:CAMPEP_0206577090 /NCGR_PEP_ID=MMETSP0325_2-20121206/31146_1 /ASSEMBLY_ACC=CAM_ASM_000347 /TAXON_ID=2866 /ORGANISM="Crypthecodinium cohnii, Strain Seligo" /LENGTH=63 /DNA_ID=CAMNT_0054082443 /DNA_START=867 /DNA_END=1054 /DNA_ORIENTATION=-
MLELERAPEMPERETESLLGAAGRLSGASAGLPDFVAVIMPKKALEAEASGAMLAELEEAVAL